MSFDTAAFIIGSAGTVLWALGRARGYEALLWLISAVKRNRTFRDPPA